MTTQDTNRTGLLRALYGANILGAGLPGALITLAPSFAETTLLWGPQDPAILSIVGSGVCRAAAWHAAAADDVDSSPAGLAPHRRGACPAPAWPSGQRARE